MSFGKGNLSELWRDSGGATVVETALIMPLFLMVMVGGMYLSMLGLTAASLHFAVQAGARCRSINTTICSDGTTTENFAAARFQSLSTAAPTFTASVPTTGTNAGCGNLVEGSITFVVKTSFSNLNVPLTAKACYPSST